MLTMEERIRYLLQAALRAEGEGDRRVARALRRMAEEARPRKASVSSFWSPALEGGSD